jgi:voltage-gated potassium channel
VCAARLAPVGGRSGEPERVNGVSEGGTPRSGMLKPLVAMVLRLLATMVILLAIYYKMPVRQGSTWSDLPWLGLDLVLFGVIVGVQVPLILRAKYPVLRSVEAMSLTVCFYLILYARLYVSISAADPQAFTQLLDHTNALYFTVTVFATVGFGDITAMTNPVKLAVTVQMLLNLIVLGVVVRLLFTLGRRSIARRAES